MVGVEVDAMQQAAALIKHVLSVLELSEKAPTLRIDVSRCSECGAVFAQVKKAYDPHDWATFVCPRCRQFIHVKSGIASCSIAGRRPEGVKPFFYIEGGEVVNVDVENRTGWLE